eukprot:SAG31_NODE_568_length_14006_cov_4.252119_13_plen_162_part_00
MVVSTVAQHAAVLYIGPRLMKPSELLPELPDCDDFVCSARAWPAMGLPPERAGWLDMPRMLPLYVIAAIPFFLLQILLEAVIQQLLAHCCNTQLPTAAKYTGVSTWSSLSAGIVNQLGAVSLVKGLGLKIIPYCWVYQYAPLKWPQLSAPGFVLTMVAVDL